MNIEYLSDTGSRYEWTCLFCDSTYVVSYHYLDDVWSVQGMRPDGQREIANRDTVDRLLMEFPADEALALCESIDGQGSDFGSVNLDVSGTGPKPEDPA